MFSLEFLNRLRLAELRVLSRFFPPQARVLEIGAGTGQQGLQLRQQGFDVQMIDIESSNYTQRRLCEITNYNGRDIPFADDEFDVVFSSNVLEHVPDLSYLHSEIRRVLKKDGFAVHVVPTHIWRIWSIFTALPVALQRLYAMRAELLPHALSHDETKRIIAALARAARIMGSAVVQRRHGERGNIFSELRLFHPSWWRRNFATNGYRIRRQMPVGIFYTGGMLFGPKLSLERRERIASLLGSACELFVVEPDGASDTVNRQ